MSWYFSIDALESGMRVEKKRKKRKKGKNEKKEK